MTPMARPSAGDGDLPLTEADFARIARIAKAGWGLSLESAKRPLIRSRLGRRVTALGLASFDAYCDVVEAGEAQESDHFVTALTTNVTHFYREAHHFEMLENQILPPILQAARSGKRVRLWSAGCSSGQEAYSLAGSILALAPEAARLDLRILGTDIDPTVLQIAQAGLYDPKICLFPTPALEERVFGRAPVTTALRPVRPELKALVTFRRLNLVKPWPISGRFDVILCRNVVIYFDKPTQRQLWARFAEVLHPGAWLLIGHSERIADPQDIGLDPAGITTYRRAAPPNGTAPS